MVLCAAFLRLLFDLIFKATSRTKRDTDSICGERRERKKKKKRRTKV